jgi:hypothetical protein
LSWKESKNANNLYSKSTENTNQWFESTIGKNSCKNKKKYKGNSIHDILEYVSEKWKNDVL